MQKDYDEKMSLSKADPSLQALLCSSEDRNDVVAVFLVAHPEKKAPSVHNFSESMSRREMRKLLIEKQESEIKNVVEKAVSQLVELGLEARGDLLSPTIFVRGSTKQILEGLALPTIIHGSLDRQIQA